jgi:AcrR family transcriptional regulator
LGTGVLDAPVNDVTTISEAGAGRRAPPRRAAAATGKAKPGMARREVSKVRTRRAILAAAQACFAEAGIGGATMDEIAERADVSRGTLFNYFVSKGDIVAALMRRRADGFATLIDRESGADRTIVERLRSVFAQSVDALQQSAPLSRRLLDPSEQGWSAAAGGWDVSERLIHAFTRLMTTAPDADRLRPDIPPEQLAEQLLGLYSGAVHLWRVREDYPLGDRLEQIARCAAELVQAR